jgi:hypothetical protein
MPFATIHPSARILKRSPLSAKSNLGHCFNTTIVATPSIKSHKQDMGLYPSRGPNRGKTCVSLHRLIAIEFTGSHKRSMIRKPSSMGIAVVEPHQEPFIVFDYPRHSGATNEGMTFGSSIFAYLVFALGRASTKGIARPMKITAWHDPGANLNVQGKDSRRPRWIRFRLGFIQIDSICTLLGGQSRDPTFAYKRLGGRSCSG